MSRMTQAKQPQRTRSSLRILAAILCLSGLLRASGYNNFATAQDAALSSTSPTEDVPTILGIPFSEEAIDILLITFQKREAELLEREASVEKRNETLSQSERQITEKIAQLTDIETKLASTLALADTAAEDDLDRLATVYENMKAKDAAALFAEMAPGFAAGFLGLMQPESAAAVMTELEPAVAHTISVMLAGRNANAFNASSNP